MILGTKRLITLKAMLAQLSHVEVEDACNLPYAAVLLASQGQDLSVWDWEFICDAIDAWDSKGEALL